MRGRVSGYTFMYVSVGLALSLRYRYLCKAGRFAQLRDVMLYRSQRIPEMRNVGLGQHCEHALCRSPPPAGVGFEYLADSFAQVLSASAHLEIVLSQRVRRPHRRSALPGFESGNALSLFRHEALKGLEPGALGEIHAHAASPCAGGRLTTKRSSHWLIASTWPRSMSTSPAP